jgi:hypothetical protein
MRKGIYDIKGNTVTNNTAVFPYKGKIIKYGCWCRNHHNCEVVVQDHQNHILYTSSTVESSIDWINDQERASYLMDE